MKKKTIIVIIVAILLLLGFVTAIVTTKFSNDLESEQLIFTGNQNITRNLTLLKDAIVTDAYLNLSGISNYINSSFSFNYSSEESDAQGLAWNGSNFFLMGNDGIQNKIYLYNESGHYTGLYFNSSGNEYAIEKGITWMDGKIYTLYDYSSAKIIIPHFSNGTIDIANIIDLSSYLSSPTGITNNDTHFFIVDGIDDYVYCFDNLGNKINFNFSTKNQVESITWAEEINSFLIGDVDSERIYEYDYSGKYTGFNVYASNPRGLTWNGTSVFYIDSDAKEIKSIFIDKPSNASLYISDIKIWNYTGDFGESEKTLNFSFVLNNALASGDCACEGCYLNGTNCIIPFIFHSDTTGILEYSDIDITWTENTPPNQTINAPAATEYNSTAIPINITTYDNDELNFCTYWVTRGAGLDVGNTTLICGETITSTAYVSSQGTTYTLHSYIRDRSGNSNYTNQTFSTGVNATIILAPVVGGGGGGGDVIIIENVTWEMETETGDNSYTFITNAGGTRNKPVLFTNIGELPLNISLSCESNVSNFCNYVTFDKTNIDLPVLKDQKTEMRFTLDLPEDIEEKNYQFNIVGVDNYNLRNSITVNVNVGTSGFFLTLGSKLFETTGIFPNYILFGLIWIFLSVILAAIFSTSEDLKSFTFITIFIGLFVALVTIYVI